MSDFKRFFFRGLAAMLPTLITLMIIIYVFTFIDQYLGRFVNVGVQWIVVQFTSLSERAPWSLVGDDLVWDRVKHTWQNYWWLSLIGFVLAFVVIYAFGRFVASYLGRGIWRLIEKTFVRMPVIRQVYPYVKQVTDFLLSEKKIEFSRVVAVTYPRKGLWSVGLVTGPGLRTVNEACGENMLTVFIPSSPTPVTGYTIMVRRDEVIDLPISIDEALRFTISGGVIAPQGQKLSQATIEEALKAPAALPER